MAVVKRRHILDGLANFHGPLSSEVKSRLRAVIEHPTDATWERAFAIILRPEPGFGVSLWQAVICVDPTFPVKGPGQDERRIPSERRKRCRPH